MGESNSAEENLKENDDEAEHVFAKIHRTRNSQISVSAVCGCGKNVEGKRCFEKCHYSNSNERKLRGLLGNARVFLKEKISFNQAQASEAVSAMRFELDPKENEANEDFWKKINSIVGNSEKLQSIGLSEQLKGWFDRLILSQRSKFSLQDESQILFILTKLPDGWVTSWAAKLAMVRLPIDTDPGLIRHYLFLVELVLCCFKTERPLSATPVNVEKDSEENTSGEDCRNSTTPSVGSNSSETFSVLEDEEILGGFEPETPKNPAEPVTKPSLGPSDLIELTRQLRLSEAIELDLIESSALIDIFCRSLEIYSASSAYAQYCSIICSYLECVVRKAAFSPNIEDIILKTSNKLLRISRLSVLYSISAFPLEQLSRDGVKRMVSLFLFSEREDGIATNEDFNRAEAQLANLHQDELSNYIRAASCFLRKIDYHDVEVADEMVALVSPLISVMVRVCFVLSATKQELLNIRQDIFGMLIDHHPPILSLLIIFFCDSIDQIGLAGISFFENLPTEDWIPGSNDISIIKDLLSNNPYDSPRSKLGQVFLKCINYGYSDGDSCVDLATHFAISNICVMESLKISESNHKRKLLSRTQETLGLAKLKLEYLSLMNSTISKLLLNKYIRDDFKDITDINVTVESSRNPILGSAALKSNEDLACAYVLCVSNGENNLSNMISCGNRCLEKPESIILALRLLEIALKMAFSKENLLQEHQTNLSAFLLKTMEISTDQCQALVSHLLITFEGLSVFLAQLIFSFPVNLESTGAIGILDTILKYHLSYPSNESYEKVRCCIRSCLKEYITPSFKSPTSPKTKWQSFTSAFSRVGFTQNDLEVKMPKESSTVVKHEVFLQIENLFRDPSLGHLPLSHAMRDALLENPSQSIEDISQEIFTRFKIHAPLCSLPIYLIGELLLSTPFNDPCLPSLVYSFLALYLQEIQETAIGYRYFDVHPFVEMISDLRKRLVEASEFHTDSISQGPQVVGISTRETSLASLLWTAALWLEEPRVHDARSELVYLPPQYGPGLLMKIRSGDNSDWKSLIEAVNFQQKLLTSAKQWVSLFSLPMRNMDFCYLTETRKPILLEAPHDNHLVENLAGTDEKFPSKDMLISADIPAVCRPLISEVILAADWQTSSLAELTQLDINYIELLPDLYQNVSHVIEITASCGTGFRGHSCQAPARVPVDIQLRTKIPEVFATLSANRNRYQEIRTNWSNPQRWVNLGHVAYTLNRMCEVLADAHSDAILETEKEQVRKQGEALFFSIVTAVTPSVTAFAPTSRIVVDLVEKLAGMFCSETASFQHLDVSIRYPTLAPILAPYFHPNAQQDDFGDMYTLVMQRLNRGDTSFAFSLLSKFNISEYAARCDENQVTDLISTLKSGLFSLAGDTEGETNVDFDTPNSDESKELVKDILTRHACDVLWTNPNISAETIIQTFLHVTTQGDGFGDAWSRIGALFDKFESGMIRSDVIEDVIKLLFGHFANTRYEEDFFTSGPWPAVLPQIAQILSTLLDLLYIEDSESSIQEHLELTFMAVEPFLKPKEDGKHFLWPIADQTTHFWDLLLIQYTRCSSASELFAQRHYLVHMLDMISYKAMDSHYASTLTNIVESQSFTELVPTSEVVEKLSNALSIDDEHLNYLVCLFSVGINWPAFFYSDDDDSQTMSFLFKILVQIISNKFPIHKLKVLNPSLLAWPELPWEKLTNEFLKHSFPDLPSKIAMDSFVHPTSCHQKALLLIREVFLNGEGKTA